VFLKIPNTQLKQFAMYD